MGAVKTERMLQIGIAVCLAAAVWGVAGALEEEKIVGPGDTAPEFRVTTDSGRTVSRSDFGGKLLVLNFWATWCSPCIEEMPSLDQFQKAFARDGVVVVGVSVDRSEQAYRNFLSRTRVAFETARDPDAKISAGYGTFKYPETYIINRDGKVVEKIIGPTNWTDEQMVSRVKALLAS